MKHFEIKNLKSDSKYARYEIRPFLVPATDEGTAALEHLFMRKGPPSGNRDFLSLKVEYDLDEGIVFRLSNFRPDCEKVWLDNVEKLEEELIAESLV